MQFCSLLEACAIHLLIDSFFSFIYVLTSFADLLYLRFAISDIINDFSLLVTTTCFVPFISQYALYTYDGKTMTLADWCKVKKLNMSTVQVRLRNGYAFDEAISAKQNINATKYEVEGRPMSLLEIEQKFGVDARLIYKRIHECGYSVYEAIHTDNSTRTYLIDNEYLTIPEISQKTGIKKMTLYNRLQRGLTIEEAIAAPIKRGTLRYNFNGQEISLTEISNIANIPYAQLYRRIVIQKLPIEQATSMD